MKQRIITAIVGILVLVAVLCFYNTIVLNIAVAVLSVIAVYELLYITKIMRKPLLLGASLFLAVLFPFTQYLKPIIIYCILFCYGCVVVFSMLRWHETIPFSNIAETVLISLLVPASFSIIVWLKLLSDHSFICLLLILAAAWLTDTGAYFAGSLFGKHKMAPQISPKKTVEGAIGGLLTTAVLYPVILWIYQMVMVSFGEPKIQFSVILAMVSGILCGFAGMMGDLCASVIKRQSGIKDYGNIMPGHGGVMDRFDSYLFAAPFFLLLNYLMPLIG